LPLSEMNPNDHEMNRPCVESNRCPETGRDQRARLSQQREKFLREQSRKFLREVRQ
jgi:hypothetical protein